MLREVFFSLLVVLALGLVYEATKRYSGTRALVVALLLLLLLLLIAFGMNVGCLFRLCSNAGGEKPGDSESRAFSHSESVLFHTLSASFVVTGRTLRIKALTCKGDLCPSDDLRQSWRIGELPGHITDKKSEDGFLVEGPLVDAMKKNAISHVHNRGFNSLHIAFLDGGETLRVSLNTDVCIGICFNQTFRADLKREAHTHEEANQPSLLCRAVNTVDRYTFQLLPRSWIEFACSQ